MIEFVCLLTVLFFWLLLIVFPLVRAGWPNEATVVQKWADIAVERMRSILDVLAGDFGF